MFSVKDEDDNSYKMNRESWNPKKLVNNEDLLESSDSDENNSNPSKHLREDDVSIYK